MKEFLFILCFFASVQAGAQTAPPLLKISANKRYFQTTEGKPFFWLGDTGWLLFSKCSREEAIQYLETRKQQGFNVVQVMVLHTLNAVNVYGDSALVNKDITRTVIPASGAGHGYWNHIDFIIQQAARRHMYIALVPVWGGNIKEGKIDAQQAALYAKFLALRFRRYNNIIWLNGGDIKGSDAPEVWNAIGATLKKNDPRHLVSFHPRGRNSSSEWFQGASWLDFNLFQSGHKDYSQDTSSNEIHHYGEDNWKFVRTDYALKPVKPTLDGEPSYENIPHGLHDSLQQRWTAADVRRYAYWSVFAGAAGFTYGENAVMQFYTRGTKAGSFGVNGNWKETIHATGAGQMKFLEELINSTSFFDRVPAPELVDNNKKDKYDFIPATKGSSHAMAYDYTGRSFSVDLSKLNFKPTRAAWYNPRNGTTTTIPGFRGNGSAAFNPPGEPANGNDWVLVLE